MSTLRSPSRKYQQKSEYLQQPSVQKEPAKIFQNYYQNWKKKEKNRKKSLTAKPVLKKTEKIDYYELYKKVPSEIHQEK